MSKSGLIRVLAVAAIAATTITFAISSWAQPIQTPPPGPSLSAPYARYLASHPDAKARLHAQWSAPAHPDNLPPSLLAGGNWHAVTTAPVSGLCNPLLLTDGTVIVHQCNTPSWYKLTPDAAGNYAAGTWSSIASLPVINGTQYQPLYHASGVLSDGRVLIMGGEYNGGDTVALTNLGAIYDPVLNSWKAVPAPTGTGWNKIGDASGTVLTNGDFLLGSCCASPDVEAFYNPKNGKWTATGAPNAGLNYQDEQGYELLPNNHVLTLDIWTNYPAASATNAEQYNFSTKAWSSAGNTPVSLVDPNICGTFEIGPAVVRGDGVVIAFGGNTGCTSPSTDPTAIYNVKLNSWTAGPTVPSVCGAGGTLPCTLADAAAALMPNGNILFDAGAGFGDHPTHFFELTAANTIQQVSDTLFLSASAGAYYYNFLVLPNGQVLETDFSNTLEVYSPVGSPVAAWAPSVTSLSATTLTRTASYTVFGKQLSGITQGAYYGDDAQAATNFPIIRITNNASGVVSYARTVKVSTRTIKPKAGANATFVVPAGAQTGPSTLAVIANGIASAPVSVTVN